MKNIALAFSGGGFRAAAYSLGCLKYLGRVKIDGSPLLENVKYISSASGGSITNLVYSSCIFNGGNLDNAYTVLNKEMQEDKLLEEALQILNTPSKWKSRDVKSRNLINAFSMAYDRIFNGQDFGIFNSRNNEPHLEEICVNATEFTNGLPFRFQSQHADNWFPKGKIGNNYIHFTENGISESQKIKLADILAASSCFPSGFEPMIFPKDYANSNVSEDQLGASISYKANSYTIDKYNHLSILSNKDYEKKRQFGLMDGGVDDNQAIDAFLKADARRVGNNLPAFDLFISCDVTSPFMDGYTLPVHENKWYDIFSIRFVLLILLVAALWLPILLIMDKGVWAPWEYITGTLSGIFGSLLGIYLFVKIKGFFMKSKPESSWGKMFKKFRWDFAKLSLGFVRQMIASRLKSVFILTNDVYLKQIRRMYYESLFSNDKYEDQVIQNTIYDLSQATIARHKHSPSVALVAVAEKSRRMGTTLWFDKKHESEDMRRSIIATGQFTTCYNLLLYLEKIEKLGALNPGLQMLKADLENDWKQFCQNPFDGLP
ncbi:patatin-like phospholipase family protein [Flavobacterium zhairuonense]|uniref:patatin-like phospholipase family protein n=1 Tax=Flavobacterium zhairuonense TaxID=2493631 RepID=UPI00104D03CE|nr:patatin-like phospholipase family protein [Flavobacterium zhairuonense]KAF2508655.1 patatin-like phospholipase family protein [Flavobacterium zhairuonense]